MSNDERGDKTPDETSAKLPRNSREGGWAESKAKRKTKRVRNRPPVPAAFSTKNSHASPRIISLRQKQAGSPAVPTAGLKLYLKRPRTTVFRWVSDAFERLTPEPARAVLKMELERLDEMFAAVYTLQ